VAMGDRSWTVAEAQRLLDPDRRWEIDRGRLIVREPASYWHGNVVGAIHRVLDAFVQAHDLGLVLVGEPGFWLERRPDTLRAPDVAFVSWERHERVGDVHAFASVAPELVVEVVSTSDRPGYLRRKVARFLAAGARSVWTVDPRRRTMTRHLSDGTVLTCPEPADVVEDPVLTGFRCRLSDLAPEVPERGT
jgi:Uma2 family endonuclease